MPTRRQTLLALCLLPLAASGCTTTTAQEITPPDYRHLPELRLNVARIATESLYDSRTDLPNVEGLSPYPLKEMVKMWLDDTVSADGSSGWINVQIIDASIREEKLDKKPGLSGLFSVDQTEIYHSHIQLLFQINFPDYSSEIRVESSAAQSVDENATLRDREQTWVRLGEKMIAEIDQSLRIKIRRDLPRLLIN